MTTMQRWGTSGGQGANLDRKNADPSGDNLTVEVGHL